MSDLAKKRQQLEAQLEAKSEEIKGRMSAIQQEVATLGDSAKEAVLKNPLLGVSGAVVAGVVLVWLLGSRRKRKLKKHRALVERYVEVLLQKADREVKKGKDPTLALQDVLHERIPMIVSDRPAEEQGGVIRNSLGLLVQSVMGIVITMAADRLLGDWLGAVEGGEDSGPPHHSDVRVQ